MTQLLILRRYVSISTGIATPNDLFLFQGRGSYGINVAQKAIGLHVALLAVPFQKALETYLHEVAHNVPEEADHGNLWRHAFGTLWETVWERSMTIAHTPDAHRSPEDVVLLTVQSQWDLLRHS